MVDESIDPQYSSYDSAAPAGMLRQHSRAIMTPTMASKMGLRPAQIQNIIEDVEYSVTALPTREQESRANIAVFKDQFASPATRYGVRWWAPGGARPMIPSLQAPSDPRPPEVYDN